MTSDVMTGDTSQDEPRDAEEGRAPQRTEPVRIVGAERAGDVVGQAPASTEPPAGEDHPRTGTGTGRGTSGSGPDRSSLGDDGWGPEDWAAPAEPQLPHWTEAPTGEIPAVLSRADDPAKTDPWASLPEPIWREERHDWEQEEAIAPGLLGSPAEEVLIPQPDETERQPWAFELGTPRKGRPAVDDEGGFSDLDDLGAGGLFGELSRSGADRDEHGGHEDMGARHVLGRHEDAGGQAGDAGVPAEQPEDGAPEDAGEKTRMLRLPAPRAARGGAQGSDEEAGRRRAHLAPVGAWARLGRRHGEHADAAAVAHEAGAESPLAAPATSRPHVRRGPVVPHAGEDALSQRAGRNIPAAVASGLVIGGLALLAFHFGTLPSLVIVTIVLSAAAVEVYAALRRDYRPASLLGIAAVAGLIVGTYDRPFVALPAVVVLLVAATFVWHLVGVDRRADPVRSTAATLLGFCWVGVLGSYAGLLLAPSLFPNRTGIAYLLGALIAAVAYDVGALVVGAWVGRHPLSPVSPGKTWEGVLGGGLAAVVFAVALVHLIHPWTLAEAAVLGVVVAVVSPIGDLCESLVKRNLGLKDMGRILPGHGGLLDRVDGLLFVLPATYYLVRAFGHG